MATLTGQKVLVTGGSGFLGSHVVEALVARGAADVAVPRSAAFDLRDAAQTHAMFEQHKPDLVVHLAASVGGIGANRRHPGKFFYDNMAMGLNVLECARTHGTAKVVVAGTICAYPKFTPVPFREDDLWNGYPEETNAPYGIAKLAQLMQAQANRAQYGQNAVYLMPTNLYGPGDKFHPEVSHVIPALMKKCVDATEAGDDHIVVWGTGSASREFLYVDDAAEGILLAAEHYDDGEPVNLGANHETPISELVDLIVEVTGFEGEVRWDHSKPDGQPRRRVDAGRAEASFGFKATTSFSEGLARTHAWYLGHREEAEARPV